MFEKGGPFHAFPSKILGNRKKARRNEEIEEFDTGFSMRKCFFALFVSTQLFAETAFQLSSQLEGVPLWKFVTVLEDKKSNFSKGEILSGERDKEFVSLPSPNLGFSTSTFWVRIPIINPTEKSISWILEYDFPLMDLLELYEFGEVLKNPISCGDLSPFQDRPLEYRNPAFPLESPPNSQSVFYLKVKSLSTIPLLLDAHTNREFYSKVSREQFLFGLFYGAMVVMIFYNAFVFFSTKDLAYGSYIGFITQISLFHLTNNGLAFQYVWSNAIWWNQHSLPFFILTSCLLSVIFAIQFLGINSEKIFLKKFLFSWLGALFILTVPCLVFTYRESIQIAIFSGVLTSVFLIYAGLRAYVHRVRTARYYLLAWAFFLTCVYLYAFKSLGILPDVFFTRWSLQLGTALLVILFSLGLADKINFLSQSLKESVNDLQTAKEKIEISEKRFRELFQGSDDTILVLDETGKILNANRALSKHLGFKPNDLQGKLLTDIVYQIKGKKESLNQILVREKLKELFELTRPVQFQAEFAQKFVMEPRDMNCRIQYVELTDTKEILVNLSPLIDDVLTKIILTEKIEFEMNNYLRNAELVAQKITSQLHKFLEANEQTEIRTAVREILINAIEHGNLGIGFEEKSKALMEGNYLEFVSSRQADPAYSQKKVKIDYVLTDSYVAYRITDEGKGFDHKKALNKTMDEVNSSFEQHGRGIVMTKSVFDTVEYNQKGNQVSLVKVFRDRL